MSAQYTTIRLVLDSIMRHPLLQDITLETAVDYAVSFMRIIGVPNIFIEKTEVIEISDYKGLLPSDFHQMIQVKDTKYNTVFRYSSDSFHMSENKEETINLTYKLQGGVIFTSIEKGKIEIAYRAIPVDECGFPLIPDNSSFIRALELYIKKQWFTILYDLGKINNNVLNQTLQDYAWAVGDCETEFKRLSIDEMESIATMWRSLLVRPNEHYKTFKILGDRLI